MESLNWISPTTARILTGTLDAELDEYLLLAYLQRVEAHYKALKLYPVLDELGARLGQLREVLARARELGAHFPSELTGLDLRRGAMLRKPIEQPAWDAVVGSLERALPQLHGALERGLELRDELHRGIRYGAVGLVPIEAREGWLMLRHGNEALVYSYTLPMVRQLAPAGRHGHVRTRYHATWTLGLCCTYGHIKAELIRTGPLPNPATFVFESSISLPRIETFLPLAKGIAYELVSASAV